MSCPCTKSSSPIFGRPRALSVGLFALLAGAASVAAAAFELRQPMTGVLPAPTGAPAALVADPAALDFGRVNLGESSIRQVTLNNTGDLPATVRFDALPSPYSLVDSTCDSPFGKDSSCAVSIRFAPTTTGAAPAEVLQSALDATPVSIALAGEGAFVSTAAWNPAQSRGNTFADNDRYAGSWQPLYAWYDTIQTAQHAWALSTSAHTSGKWYWEVAYHGNGWMRGGVATSDYRAYGLPARLVSIAWDADAGTVTLRADCGAPSVQAVPTGVPLYAFFEAGGGSLGVQANFGQSAFQCGVPAGFTPGF